MSDETKLKIDLGCGGKKKGPEWVGVDAFQMEGVDHICNIGKDRWPFDDNSVDEANAAHVLEHLTNFGGKWERIHFFNELGRVLKKGAQATIIIPHWASNRYYGDPTHCEPFSEMGFFYIKKEWRDKEAPHTDISFNPNGYSCDFDATFGYALHEALASRNDHYKKEAVMFYKEAVMEIHATVTKR